MSSRKPRPEDLAEALRADIATGALEPGATLVQDALAKRYGVSRIPVREALKQLEAEGLVDIVFGDGTFVHSPDRDEVVEIFELRMQLEPHVLRLSVPRLGPRDFEAADAALAALRQSDSEVPVTVSDWHFFEALYAGATRPLYLHLIRDLRLRLSGLINHVEAANDRAAIAADLDSLLETVRKGDEKDAASRLVRYLIRTRETLVAALPA